MARRMREHEELGAKIDVHEAASHVLQIGCVLLPLLGGEEPAHRADIAGEPHRVAPAREDALDRGRDEAAQIRVARHRPRPREGKMFPGLGFVLLIVDECGKRQRDRPFAARGTKSHVDLVKAPVRRGG